MTRKRKSIAIGILVIVSILGVLLYNRSRIAAGSKPGLQTSFPVSVMKAEKHRLTHRLSLTGTVSANRDVAIISETQGKVTSVRANIGDYRAAGAVLVEVDDELKKVDLVKAEAGFEKAKKDWERFAKLNLEKAVTESQKENAWRSLKVAEAEYVYARRQYNNTRIATPIAGVLTSRSVELGTMVMPGMVVGNVVDITRLKVKLNVAEQDAFLLQKGDTVMITTDVYPGAVFPGTINTISVKADEQHTYPVEIGLANSPQHPLKAGMFARVEFVSIQDLELLALPRDAIIGSLKKARVFVVRDNIASVRDIIVGVEAGALVEVLSGLQEGEFVVTNGQTNLRDGSVVEVVK